MYYDSNPEKHRNEWETNIYKSLLDWINKHKGCTVPDIKIHIELLIEEKKKYAGK